MLQNYSIETLNQHIAQFLNCTSADNYTHQLPAVWPALEKLQELNYGFSITSLGRQNFKVRIIKWAASNNGMTGTGEYIVTVLDYPVAKAVSRAVVETLNKEQLLPTN